MEEPGVDPTLPSRALEEILSRPEFGQSPREPSGWLQRLLEMIGQTVERFPSWTDDAILLLLALLALILIAVLLRDGGLGGRVRGAETGAEEVAQAVPRIPAAELQRRGREALAAGDHSAAVVFLFRAIVAHLSATGILLEDPSRTNREHRRDLRGRPAEAEAFDRAVPAFERVRYGRRPATPEDARTLDRCADAVLAGDRS